MCANVLECDKATCWNELGRMMVWCGDRQHAATFFRKSLEAVFDMLNNRELMKEERFKDVHHKMVWCGESWCTLNGVHTGSSQYIFYDGIYLGCGVS